jgi:hypothetical protein
LKKTSAGILAELLGHPTAEGSEPIFRVESLIVSPFGA